MQQQARRVASAMRKRGVPVRMVTGGAASIEHVPWTRIVPMRVLSADRGSFPRALLEHLLRYRNSYDVVHVHGFGSETFGAILARRITRKPLVVKPSTSGPGTKLDQYRRFSRLLPGADGLWRRVDAWVSISGQTSTDLAAMGVPGDRIAFVPNGVNTAMYRAVPHDRRQALRETLGVRPEQVVVCTACRLEPHKRVDLLLRAFLALPPELPAKLWVMGAGEELPALRELAGSAVDSGRIQFHGFVRGRHMLQYLQAADVFALVSRWEGLSNALLEAMACGLPALVSDVSGMADVVGRGECGVTVPPDDLTATQAALDQLVNSQPRRSALGQAAALRVRECYSLDRTVDSLLSLYTSLMAKGR
jgi:glycosyltransferase involved in cell wall biosynthesis